MMRKPLSVLVFAGYGVLTQSALAADTIEIRVTSRSAPPPTAVTIQREGTVNDVPLVRLGTDAEFSVSVDRPTASQLALEKVLNYPYHLVASWDDGKEPLYLAVTPQSLSKINIQLLHPVETAERRTLDSIEALGSDFASTLEKYFRARAFHRKWRFENKQPYHQVALRSARIWFDASTDLAKRANSYFRLDDEVRKFMDEYERKAANDLSFRSFYRSYANVGYVSATVADLNAARYRFVSLIPKLVAEGRLDEAQELNEKAIAVLENETLDAKRDITKRQGINIELLKANAAYISTKKGIYQ